MRSISFFTSCSQATSLSPEDRKSTRLNSSHVESSNAVFCLKKKIDQQESHCRLMQDSECMMLDDQKVNDEWIVLVQGTEYGPANIETLRDWKSDFFFNDTATTEIYTLSLHDALPI